MNPYRALPIYSESTIEQYRNRKREENPPHIFAIAERAWVNMREGRESQSVLITYVHLLRCRPRATALTSPALTEESLAPARLRTPRRSSSISLPSLPTPPFLPPPPPPSLLPPSFVVPHPPNRSSARAQARRSRRAKACSSSRSFRRHPSSSPSATPRRCATTIRLALCVRNAVDSPSNPCPDADRPLLS